MINSFNIRELLIESISNVVCFNFYNSLVCLSCLNKKMESDKTMS